MNDYETARETVLLANADYETRRAADKSRTWSMRTVEREWKLRAGQLRYFRANRERREYAGVTRLFGKAGKS